DETEVVLACTRERVFDEPEAFALVERDGAAVRDRAGFQSLVSVVLSDGDVARRARLPTNDARLRFVADEEGRVGARRVLLLAVNLDGRMKGRRAKLLARARVGCVDVRARVGDETHAARRDLNRQRVVVAVRAAPREARAARAQQQ